MGRFLDAAYDTLDAAGLPLTASEIVEIALELGHLNSSGATPEQTMKARLSDDIRARRSRSLFMRVEKGRFALRAWMDRFPEYVADRFQQALLDEDAVVFERSYLSLLLPGPGLHVQPLEDGSRLLGLCRPMLRREAEEDPSVIQLVSGFLVRWSGKYLTYRRSARLPEARLHGEYSISFGGHLTPRDLFDSAAWPADPNAALWNLFDPINGIHLLLREFNEELRVKRTPSFTYRGLLYDDSREVSRQHIAIVYDVELQGPEYTIGERGFLLDPKFESLSEVLSRAEDFENWSRILIGAEVAGKGQGL